MLAPGAIESILQGYSPYRLRQLPNPAVSIVYVVICTGVVI